VPIAEIKPIAALPSKKRPIVWPAKNILTLKLATLFLTLSRTTFLLLLMAKTRETLTRYLHFSMDD
jgi:hypothetical protein